MKLKITDEKLEDIMQNDYILNGRVPTEWAVMNFKTGFRAAEQTHQVMVDKFMEEIKRISDESTHGDNCRAIIYQGIRNCDCHKSEIDKMLKELKLKNEGI